MSGRLAAQQQMVHKLRSIYQPTNTGSTAMRRHRPSRCGLSAPSLFVYCIRLLRGAKAPRGQGQADPPYLQSQPKPGEHISLHIFFRVFNGSAQVPGLSRRPGLRFAVEERALWKAAARRPSQAMNLPPHPPHSPADNSMGAASGPMCCLASLATSDSFRHLSPHTPHIREIPGANIAKPVAAQVAAIRVSVKLIHCSGKRH